MTFRSIATALVVAVCAAVGLVIGMGAAAECPAEPLPGLASGPATLVAGGAAVVLVVMGVVAAIARRSLRGALLPFMLAAGLAGGFALGQALSKPECWPPGGGVATDGMASLELGSPYGTSHGGSIVCSPYERSLELQGGIERSTEWASDTDGVSLLYLAFTTGQDVRVGNWVLVLSQGNRQWATYTNTNADQLNLEVDGRHGTLTFAGVPLSRDNSRPSEPTPPATISGQFSWRCDAP